MPQTLIAQAEQAIAQQDYVAALTFYQQAHQKGFPPEQLLKGLSFAQYHLQQYPASLDNLQTYLKLNASDGEAWRNLAICAKAAEQATLAEQGFIKAITLGFANEFEYTNLIALLENRGALLDALLWLHQAKAQLGSVDASMAALLAAEQKVCQQIDAIRVPKDLPEPQIEQLLALAEQWLYQDTYACGAMANRLIEPVTDNAQLSQRLLNLYQTLTTIDANLPMVTFAYALLLHRNKQVDLAMSYYLRALALQPNHIDGLLNFGMACRQTIRYQEGIHALEKAKQLGTDNGKLWENLAICYVGVGRMQDALEAYQKALVFLPDSPNTRYSHGIVHLLLGNFKQGWLEYQYRVQILNLKHQPTDIPRWNAQPLTGKHLLIIHEQGLGDTINFIRFAGFVASLAGKVTLKVQKPLYEQMTWMLNLPKNCDVVNADDVVEQADFFCSYVDLPGLLSVDLNNMNPLMPYFVADPKRSAKWQQQLAAIDKRKVGLVWGGNPGHARDSERSLELTQLLPLVESELARQQVQFISLQMGEPLSQLSQLSPDLILDLSADIASFADTAALIEQLDLVITVDTSVAHMAGAMNKPVWVLVNYIPDWRWLFNRTDSPWYPSMRLFRQQQLDCWQGALQHLASVFHHFLLQQDWISDTQLHQWVQQGQFELVKQASQSRLTVNEHDIEAIRALAMMANKQHAPHLAEQHLTQIIKAVDFDLDAELRLGEQQVKQGQFAEALARMLAVVPMQGGNVNLFILIGQALHRLGRHAEALSLYQKALDANPDNFDAQAEMATALKNLGRYDEALALARKVHQMQPDNFSQNSRLGMLELALGNFESGWALFDQRWQTEKFKQDVPIVSRPVWRGEPLTHLAIYDEQGLGDTIQFLRYLPLAAQRAEKVSFYVKSALLSVCRHLPNNVSVFEAGEIKINFEAHCSLMSLPVILNMERAPLASSVPYLPLVAATKQKWQDKLGGFKQYKVALVWAGNPEHSKDQFRSLELGLLAPLFELAGIDWLSVQLGAGQKTLQQQDWPVTDLSADIEDFTDTAAILSNVDLLISIDTSVAHLAGAIDCPTWLLLHYDPDWRWLVKGDTSRWYPSMRLFRQAKQYQWQGVIEQVKLALIEQVNLIKDD